MEKMFDYIVYKRKLGPDYRTGELGRGLGPTGEEGPNLINVL